MKKQRVVRLIAALLMAVCVMGTTSTQVSAAGCGNWQICATGTPFCKDAGCGFLWHISQTHYQEKKYKRNCIRNDNTFAVEFKYSMEKLGCC